MTTIILYRPELETPSRRGGRFVKGIHFVGGRNTISAETYKKIKTDPFFVTGSETGVFSVIENVSKKNSEQVKDLGDFNVPEALKVITMEKDLKVLKQWQSKEGAGRGRVTVMNALARQIGLIEGGEL